MGLKDFLKTQGEVYEKFHSREQEVRKIGINADSALVKKVGGHVVVGLYSESTLSKVEVLSEKIAKILPSIPYGKKNAHITFVAMTEENFSTPDYGKIAKMISATEMALLSLSKQECLIEFTTPTFSDACVILEGIPRDDTFLNISSAIISSFKQNGLEVKVPWGAHSTISRFWKAQPAAELAAFFQLMDETRKSRTFAQTKIESIGVGYCTASMRGFDLYLERIFQLS